MSPDDTHTHTRTYCTPRAVHPITCTHAHCTPRAVHPITCTHTHTRTHTHTGTLAHLCACPSLTQPCAGAPLHCPCVLAHIVTLRNTARPPETFPQKRGKVSTLSRASAPLGCGPFLKWLLEQEVGRSRGQGRATVGRGSLCLPACVTHSAASHAQGVCGRLPLNTEAHSCSLTSVPVRL